MKPVLAEMTVGSTYWKALPHDVAEELYFAYKIRLKDPYGQRWQGVCILSA